MDQKLDFTPGDKPDIAKTATLELTAKQTEIVTLAVKMGELSLVLRSLQDPPDEERDSASGEDATAELGDSYTHDSQVSRLIKDPNPPPKPPDAMKTSVFVLHGNRATKQELDGSVVSDPSAAPADGARRHQAACAAGDHRQSYPRERAAMSPSFASASTAPAWRRAASSLALAASLAFALQPSLLMAQVQMSDPDKPAAKAAPQRACQEGRVAQEPDRQRLGRSQPSRSGACRTGRAGDDCSVPHGRAGGHARQQPTGRRQVDRTQPGRRPDAAEQAATPPRAPIVSASLTSDAGAGQQGATRPQPQYARRRCPRRRPPAPVPVPIPPPPAGPPGQPASPAPGGASGRPFGQSQLVPTEAPTLTLEVNKGTALKLPGPAATVFVAAPDIADVQVRSPNMVYVFAKKPGDTVLYAVDAQDRVLLNTIVRVTSPLSRIKGQLDAIHPGNGVIFDNQAETIVLTGSVRSAAVAEDARRLALQQVNGNPTKVISNIQIDAPTQVQLRVKVAEVKREALKRVGINWQNINNIALFGTGTVLGRLCRQDSPSPPADRRPARSHSDPRQRTQHPHRLPRHPEPWRPCWPSPT